MISLAAIPLPIGRKKGSVSHTSHKQETGVQLFGSSDGCTPALFYFLNISSISFSEISSHSGMPGNLGCGDAKLWASCIGLGYRFTLS